MSGLQDSLAADFVTRLLPWRQTHSLREFSHVETLSTRFQAPPDRGTLSVEDRRGTNAGRRGHIPLRTISRDTRPNTWLGDGTRKSGQHGLLMRRWCERRPQHSDRGNAIAPRLGNSPCYGGTPLRGSGTIPLVERAVIVCRSCALSASICLKNRAWRADAFVSNWASFLPIGEPIPVQASGPGSAL